MTNAFISYAKEDIRIAREICEFLADNGHTPWLERR